MKIQRQKIGHLMVEVMLPSAESRGTIILLPGLPQLLHKHKLSQAVAERGWEVWTPQLSGSWDSGKTFAPEQHVHDVHLLTQHAQKLSAIVGYSYSAGLAIAHAITSKTDVPLVLIGAIFDFQTYQDQADSLLTYLTEYFPLTYRIDKKSLAKYLTGATYNGLEHAQAITTKILIFAGEHDKNHNSEAVLAFVKSSHAVMHVLPCGHSLDDFAKQSSLYSTLEHFILAQ